MKRTDRNTERGAETDEEPLSATMLSEGSDRASLTGQFYRGEVDRMVGWRSRLDQTTNWAVVVMAAILTFSFSSPDNPHYVLLIGVLAVLAFLVIESQRYREYDAWRYRVRLLQRHFVATVVDGDGSTDDDWQRALAENLRRPSLRISRRKAMGHRLRRVYILLLTVLVAAWLVRISVFQPGEGWSQAAAVAGLSGRLVVAAVVGLYLALGAVAVWSLFEDRALEFRAEA